MEQLRFVRLRFGTARQKMALERWTNPNLSRRTCTREYGLQSCRGKSAGHAKRARERSPTRNPYRYDSRDVHRCESTFISASRASACSQSPSPPLNEMRALNVTASAATPAAAMRCNSCCARSPCVGSSWHLSCPRVEAVAIPPIRSVQPYHFEVEFTSHSAG
jgi:hypothetical protein